VVFAGFVFAHSAFAQQTTGDITGTVTDSTGAVLPNVSVTAINTGTNASRSSVTNDTGAFRIPPSL
jgi:carboxypeptidase family protein